MFNFDLVNNALTDMNVSDSEFRTMYLIANNCSLNDSESIEMYNAYIMSKLKYSESTVKRCIKALEEKGYISVQRATQKRKPNVITLNGNINECRAEATNEFTDAVKNDTLYNNIYNNINNIQSIQSIQSNSIEDKLAREEEERKKKALDDFLSLLDDDSDEDDNDSETLHCTDIVNDNFNEDDGLNHDSYEGEQMGNENASYDSTYNSNVGNEDLQNMRGKGIVDSKSYDEIQGIQSIQGIGTETYKSNSIDWNEWRTEFERRKRGILNAKCKTDFDLWKGLCGESLNFAKEHMRPEKYEKQREIFERWYDASEPHFNYREPKNTMQTTKRERQFRQDEWNSMVEQIDLLPIKEPLVEDALKYLISCGRDTSLFITQVREKYGIIVN